jgi:hypothetical protein
MTAVEKEVDLTAEREASFSRSGGNPKD